jgi:hypothetical protein
MNATITLSDAAALLRISKTTLHKRLSTDIFAPNPLRRGRGRGGNHVYSRAELIEWHNNLQKTSDGRAVLTRRMPGNGTAGIKTLDLTLAQQFIRGAFDRAGRREKQQIKMLAARHFKHTTQQTKHIKGEL